jgi:hypothetical protein
MIITTLLLPLGHIPFIHHLSSTQRPNVQKPTKIASTSQEKSTKERWLVQIELYSLLPLCIETPKREE